MAAAPDSAREAIHERPPSSARGGSHEHAIGAPRVVILPLANISPDPADAYFAEGLTEELISSLSRMGGLRVIARATSMRFAPAGPSGAPALARESNVHYLLEGSVRKAGDRLRIGVRLIDASSEENLWSETYDRTLADVFAIQSEIAERLAGSLRVEIGKAARDRLS